MNPPGIEPAPVRSGEVICGNFNPFTMADGVALRAALCLVCSQAVGGSKVQVRVFLGFEDPPCDCGNLGPVAFFVHDTCPDYGDQIMTDLAVATVSRSHQPLGGICP